MTRLLGYRERRLLEEMDAVGDIALAYGHNWPEFTDIVLEVLTGRAAWRGGDSERAALERARLVQLLATARDTYHGMPAKDFFKVCESLGFESVSGWKTLSGMQHLLGRPRDGSVVLLSEIDARVDRATYSYAYLQGALAVDSLPRWLCHDVTSGFRLLSGLFADEYPTRISYWWSRSEEGEDDQFSPYVWPEVEGEREHHIQLWKDNGENDLVPWNRFHRDRLGTVRGDWAIRLDIAGVRTGHEALALSDAEQADSPTASTGGRR